MIDSLNTSTLVATATQRRMVNFFKALSDDTRQKILKLLDGGEQTVTQIVSNFNLSQPTISRHLAVLSQAELVTGQRRGQNVYYSLNEGVLNDTMNEFLGRFDAPDAKAD